MLPDCPRCGSPDIAIDADERELSCRSCGYRWPDEEEQEVA
jgi:hypothetical protein